ncbi:MAG: hypothetical protein MZV65_00210 [Chromatiales bacterium]|nr:hypothetical protein [Chromatiales bacterium]
MPRLPAADAALAQAAALLLLVVFALKAALLPLHFWLPRHLCRGRGAGGGAVRDHDQGRHLRHRCACYTLVFGADAGDAACWRALAAAGWRWRRWRWRALGALAARAPARAGRPSWWSPRPARCWLALGLASAAALAARRSTTWCTAPSSPPRCSCWPSAIGRQRGAAGDALEPAPALAAAGAARRAVLRRGGRASAGLPPLAGFVGKLAAPATPRSARRPGPGCWACVLVSGLLVHGGAGAGRQPAVLEARQAACAPAAAAPAGECARRSAAAAGWSRRSPLSAVRRRRSCATRRCRPGSCVEPARLCRAPCSAAHARSTRERRDEAPACPRRC